MRSPDSTWYITILSVQISDFFVLVPWRIFSGLSTPLAYFFRVFLRIGKEHSTGWSCNDLPRLYSGITAIYWFSQPFSIYILCSWPFLGLHDSRGNMFKSMFFLPTLGIIFKSITGWLSVFREKRDTDLQMTASIFPFSQSSIIRRNCGLLLRSKVSVNHAL